MQNLSSAPALLNQNLHFSWIPGDMFARWSLRSPGLAGTKHSSFPQLEGIFRGNCCHGPQWVGHTLPGGKTSVLQRTVVFAKSLSFSWWSNHRLAWWRRSRWFLWDKEQFRAKFKEKGKSNGSESEERSKTKEVLIFRPSNSSPKGMKNNLVSYKVVHSKSF